MKVNLILFSLFLLVSIMACNVLHFPFRVVEVRGAIKRLKNISDDDHTLYKTSAITGDFV